MATAHTMGSLSLGNMNHLRLAIITPFAPGQTFFYYTGL